MKWKRPLPTEVTVFSAMEERREIERGICVLCLFRGIQALFEHEEPLIKIFCYEVGEHGQNLYQVSIPTEAIARFGQRRRPPSGQGREYQVECRYLQHGNGNVRCGLEGIFSVQCKIPKD